MTEAEKIKFVKEASYNIGHIYEPSSAVQMAAVEADPKAIYYIKNPHEAVQLAAVQANWWSIYYIETPLLKTKLRHINYHWRLKWRIKFFT